jgi:anti-sigma factor RsiW
VSAGHLSFDELAELAEGLLARKPARAAQEHLATCDECSARAATLQRTTSALGDVGPVSMPADVAARLEGVLAGAGNEPAGETVVPDLSAIRQRRQAPPPWIMAAAAAVVLIAAGSTILATRGGHHNAPGSAREAGAVTPLVATSAQHPPITEESGRVYTPTSLAALAPGLATAGGAGTAATNVPVGGGSAASAGGGAVAPPAPSPQVPLTSGAPVHKNAVTAPGFASGSTTRSGPEDSQEFTAAAIPAPLRRYADSQQLLLKCAAFITDTPGAAPLAVDYARWTNPASHARHVPALVLVFADPKDSSEIDVYVVAPACDDSSLLDFQLLAAS